MLLRHAETMELAEPLAHFEAHGYARLGRVLDDAGLAALRERAEDLMLARVTYPGMFFQLDSETGRTDDAPIGPGWKGPSLAYRKLERLELDERFRRWLSNPLFERVARAKIDGDVVLYRAILFNKGMPGGSEIPWHQDGGKLWGLSQDAELQIWTALDDAPLDGGCLEVIPGSHRGGFVTELGGVVPMNPDEAASAEARAVALPCRAGEAVLVHNKTWHRSGRSRPGHRRMGLSLCYMSGETKCLRKKRAPRDFFRVFEARE